MFWTHYTPVYDDMMVVVETPGEEREDRFRERRPIREREPLPKRGTCNQLFSNITDFLRKMGC